MPPNIAEPIRYRGRFAPSPTGPLHLGSLTAALGSWLMARRHGGEWLVRVEDLDPPRELAGMAQEQIDGLASFGMESDRPVVWQSRRSELYADALRGLVESDLAFPCRCSRGDLSASAGVHRQCVAQPSGSFAAYRLRVPPIRLGFQDEIRGRFEQDLGEEVGDVVLKRADGYWAYQLAVVVDDAQQEITHVVRGADLIDSTPRQILLQRLLGVPTPAYAHLPVIRQPGGLKLSKSLRSLPVEPADPLPALRLAFSCLGQDAAALEGYGAVGPALQQALGVFQPDRIPDRDHFLP